MGCPKGAITAGLLNLAVHCRGLSMKCSPIKRATTYHNFCTCGGRIKGTSPVLSVPVGSERLNLKSSRKNTQDAAKDIFSIKDEKYTHFGYERVKEKEKQKKVYDVFENVAESYDLMNDLMSVGIHRMWKNRFVSQLKVRPGMVILDVAGGTGDIAFKMLDALVGGSHTPKETVSSTKITVCDINQAMLDVGQRRASRLGLENYISWMQGNAEHLPLEDDSVDLFTIAFGIRNCTHVDRVLQEAFRVLKPGGRLSCLEFSNVENPILKEIYDEYSFQVIPVLGQLFASDWNSYRYLVESIRQFPKQESFADMMYDAGFCNVSYENLTFGVCAIHDGFKL